MSQFRSRLFMLFCFSLYFTSQSSAQTFSGSGGDIPDDGTTALFPIEVSGLPVDSLSQAWGVAQVCLNIEHPWDSDLVIQLQSPDGKRVTLISGLGGDQDNFTNTCLRQDAEYSIALAWAPFSGVFKPMGQLGNFNDELQQANGTWNLRIYDTYPQDMGKLLDWSISFEDNAPTPFLFTHSNLPIFKIDTDDQDIPNDPKIGAQLQIIDNGPGQINAVNDPANAYDGPIGIELRGNFSAVLPQKPYGFETRDANGEEFNISLLGMPEEHDWCLIANYNDKVFMRNALPYHLFDSMGHYAPKTRFCEVLLNGQYQGIYLFCEKIKRDKNRLDIAKLEAGDNSGEALTGGYIIKNDYFNENNSWQGEFNPIGHPDNILHFVYEYPKPEDITDPQKEYIRNFIYSFESNLYSDEFADPATGYASYIDVNSFIDYFIVEELSRNIDGFRKSAFYHKQRDDKGGKLAAGPVWDFDWAWKNIPECPIFAATDGSGWAHLINDCNPDVKSFGWHIRLLQDTNYVNRLRCRWEELRGSILDTAYLFNYIETQGALLDAAQMRHYIQWPILGINVGTPEVNPQAADFRGELDTFKRWIHLRLDWLDAHIGGHCPTSATTPDLAASEGVLIFPNPASDKLFLNLENSLAASASAFSISDLSGRELLHWKNLATTGEPQQFDIRALQPGVYLCRLQGTGGKWSRTLKLVVQRRAD